MGHLLGHLGPRTGSERSSEHWPRPHRWRVLRAATLEHEMNIFIWQFLICCICLQARQFRCYLYYISYKYYAYIIYHILYVVLWPATYNSCCPILCFRSPLFVVLWPTTYNIKLHPPTQPFGRVGPATHLYFWATHFDLVPACMCTFVATHFNPVISMGGQKTQADPPVGAQLLEAPTVGGRGERREMELD